MPGSVSESKKDYRKLLSKCCENTEKGEIDSDSISEMDPLRRQTFMHSFWELRMAEKGILYGGIITKEQKQKYFCRLWIVWLSLMRRWTWTEKLKQAYGGLVCPLRNMDCTPYAYGEDFKAEAWHARGCAAAKRIIWGLAERWHQVQLLRKWG